MRVKCGIESQKKEIHSKWDEKRCYFFKIRYYLQKRRFIYRKKAFKFVFFDALTIKIYGIIINKSFIFN